MKRRVALCLTALVGGSLLAACGDDDDDDDATSEIAEANTEFCEDLVAYNDTLTAFGALDPTTATKADYESAVEEVRDARTELTESGADLAEAEFDNLEAQAEDLDGALADAPDDAAVADIVAAAQAQVTEVQASSALLNTAVCTAGNSTATTET